MDRMYITNDLKKKYTKFREGVENFIKRDRLRDRDVYCDIL
jgi:hypothetical protein